jgi:glucose dehydrogenase
MSSDGSKVYVMEASTPFGQPDSYVLIALDAATGNQLWTASKNLPAQSGFTPAAIALSPNGSQVFLTGSSGTVAFNATDGAVLWSVRYKNSSMVTVDAIAVSPDSSKVFVTGSIPSAPQQAYWTVAYNTATGAQVWSDIYHGLGDSQASSIGVTPSGSGVFVTGTTESAPTEHGMRIATVAYDPATGARLWVASYQNEAPAVHQLTAPALAVTPDSSTVVISGARYVNSGPGDYVLLAYSTGTGAPESTAIYQAPDKGGSDPVTMALSPDSSMAFVTGFVLPATSNLYEYQTVAFRF